MTFALDPLVDARWEELVNRHPRASVFHRRGWLEALKRTYGYDPTVLTTTAQGQLENGLVFCRVRTWASRRLVSLPFSDHCDPLVDRPDELAELLEALTAEMAAGRWRSFELRPRRTAPAGLRPRASYWLHTLDLARPEHEIFDRFHASSTKRAIRKAEQAGLVYETGASDRLLAMFFGLVRQTRRRHGLPPQPFEWFRTLQACLPGSLTVHVVSSEGVPAAAMLTLSSRNTLVYKYGGSDRRYHPFGAVPFLFWRVIQEARARGHLELDLGRSDLDQPGLTAFKDHLGAARTTLTYCGVPDVQPSGAAGVARSRLARGVIRLLPDVVLDLTGRLLYRHLG